MATGAEEALLPPPPPPPPGSPAGSELFVGSNFAVCRCGEDAADAIAALQGSRAAFDHVLHHAKNAIAVLEQFCTCYGYHESAGLVLICFLAQKVVTAYRQTLCTCGASARNGGVLIPEIRFGSYRIVGEEGLLLMRQVVVVELRKLRRMVDQLREKLRDRGGGCDNAHSSLLQGFLQAELKSVLAEER